MASFLFFSPFEDNFSAFIWCILAGLIFGILYVYFSSKNKAKIIKKLKNAGAVSPETAISPEKLGSSASLSGFTAKTDSGDIYIPEKFSQKALFAEKTANTNPLFIIAAIIAIYLIAAAVHKIIPIYYDEINTIFIFGRKK